MLATKPSNPFQLNPFHPKPHFSRFSQNMSLLTALATNICAVIPAICSLAPIHTNQTLHPRGSPSSRNETSHISRIFEKTSKGRNGGRGEKQCSSRVSLGSGRFFSPPPPPSPLGCLTARRASLWDWLLDAFLALLLALALLFNAFSHEHPHFLVLFFPRTFSFDQNNIFSSRAVDFIFVRKSASGSRY